MVVVDDFTCGTCLKQFPSGWQARDKHCSALGHDRPAFECDTCPRYFKTSAARFQHMEACNHFEYDCDTCGETWPTVAQLREHEQDEHDYWHCDECDDGFYSAWALQDHREEDHLLACQWCDSYFELDEQLERHEEQVHHFCHACDRMFDSAHSLAQHRRSRTHLGTPISCPFCQARYATATGVVHHVERGSCPNAGGVDRQAIFKMMKQRDPKGYVTKLLLTYDTATYSSTKGGWNGDAWECTLCLREFGTQRALDQHLQSPAHAQNLYHCPNGHCRKDFTTLAAAVNHLESEGCGFMRFNQVQNRMGSLIGSNRLLVF